MGSLFQYTIAAFMVTFVIMPITIKVLQLNKILDSPNERKLHSDSKPSLGGIAILIGFLASVFLWFPLDQLRESKYLLGGIVFITLLGLRDDLFDLRARQKLVGQIIAGIFISSTAGIRLSSFHGLFGLTDMPYYLSFSITIFTIIVITNAFNLIDGIDGLAGSVAVISLTFFAIWHFLIGEAFFGYILMAMVGSVLGFLYYNWHPSKIFMGDTGSLVLGFIISIAAINFIETNALLSNSSTYKFTGGVLSAVGVLAIPLFDTLRVFIIRVSEKKSPLLPDNNHIHHSLLKLKFNHSKSTIILAILNLFIIAEVVLLKDVSNLILGAIILSTLCLYSVVVGYLVKTNKLAAVTRLRLIKSRQVQRKSA